MSEMILGIPDHTNPCTACTRRDAKCHGTCRDYKLWTVICNAHRNRQRKYEAQYYAPINDMSHRVRTVSGKAPVVAMYRRRNTKTGGSLK